MIKVNKLLSKKGFTLIELLVVIAIIGILATIIVASFTSAQQRGRDSRRKADLDAVKKALELAKADCTGGAYYPIVSTAVTGNARYDVLETHLDDPDLAYIRNVPVDPSRLGVNDYHYTTSFTGGTSAAAVCLDTATPPARTIDGYSGFLIKAELENLNDPSGAESRTRCASSGVPAGAPPAGTNPYYVCE